ncbi:MAG: hypothetical protein VX672_03500 [Planctomycetota bacterium]|nr:hypothetical protein [Planctomycetota bacterium]
MERSRGFARRPAFTVVELLVVMAIIILLIGILLVGLSQAAGTAQKAQTRFLMNSMAAALAQFKGDHGYLPPVLADGSLFGGQGTPDNLPGWSRDVVLPPPSGPDPDNDQVRGRQNWFSVTSPSEYLLGYGDRTADGYGLVGGFADAEEGQPGFVESPAVGFRSPGGDGAWGAIFNPRTGYESFPGTFIARNPVNAGLPYVPPSAAGFQANDIKVRGRIYGPYLELKDENLLGGLRPDGTVARPEDPDYATRPKVILDYWGTPIRYYRNPYVGGDPRADVGGGLGISDVFALRPWTLEEGVFVDGIGDDMSGDGNYNGGGDDSATTPQLKAGEFALLSAGPDRRISRDARVDVDEFNRDNIVEIGP